MKTIRIKMTDNANGVCFWTIQRIPRAFNCGDSLKRSRYVSGWSWTDHDGYERFSEGNWLELVTSFLRCAANYGFTCNLS